MSTLPNEFVWIAGRAGTKRNGNESDTALINTRKEVMESRDRPCMEGI